MGDNQNIKHKSLFINMSDFTKIDNKGFVKGKVRIAYAGDNRNNSHITKEAFERAEKTLFNIPIVGNWLGDNFGGHDLIMETKGNKLSIKDNTVPIGVVPENANPRWEEVEDEYGNKTNYYTCDVILWQERYPEEVQFIMDNGANQSMEIFVEDGEYNDTSNKYKIDDFYYSALCILGKDEDDPENNVEPCFEDSAISIDFGKSFDDEFQQMIQGFSRNKKGDDDMSKELEKQVAKLEIENEELTKTISEFTTVNKDMEEAHNTLKEQNEALEVEVAELREFKETIEKARVEEEIKKLKNEYSLLLTKEELDSCFEEDIPVEKFEVNLSLAYAKSQIEKAKKETKGDFKFTDYKSKETDDGLSIR